MIPPIKYILDTNIVSELMRPRANEAVLSFIDRTAEEGMGISAVTVWEIFNGIAKLSPGRKRCDLESRFTTLVEQIFEDHVLPWGDAEARVCSDIMEKRRCVGRSLDDHFPDAMIASAAITRKLILVTRNASEFRDIGIELANPWHA